MVADISPASALNEFRKSHPTRFLDVGVSEQSLIGISSGLAINGFKVFAYTIANFAIYRPFEQIRVDLCYQNLPVVVVGVGGGVSYSALGSTHHTIEDVAVMSALPNMTILAPCDPSEVVSCVEQISQISGPAYLRLGKSGEPILTKSAVEDFKIGKVRQIKSGRTIAILGYGPILGLAFDALNQLSNLRDEISIYSVHTLKPLDDNRIIEILNKYSKIIILEEHVHNGGLSTLVTKISAETRLKTDLRFINLKDDYVHTYGSRNDVLEAHNISLPRLLKEILN